MSRLISIEINDEVQAKIRDVIAYARANRVTAAEVALLDLKQCSVNLGCCIAVYTQCYHEDKTLFRHLSLMFWGCKSPPPPPILLLMAKEFGFTGNLDDLDDVKTAETEKGFATGLFQNIQPSQN